MPVTMSEIAREAQVSRSLVSRLLRGDRTLKVAPATRKRVWEVHDQLGGVQGRERAAAPQGPCQVIVPRNRACTWNNNDPLASLLINMIVEPMEQVLDAHTAHLMFTAFDEQRRYETFTRLMEMTRGSGALLLLNGVVDQRVMELLAEYRFPHVSLDPDAEMFDVNTVVADQFGGMRQVVNHLKELGHERIAYLGPRRCRYPHFHAAMASYHMPFNEDDVCEVEVRGHGANVSPRLMRQLARDAFTDWLGHHSLPTALHCHNDWLAFGAVDAVRACGFEPGRDISIVGYDNIEQHLHDGQRDPEHSDRAAAPVLTTIANPLQQIGRHAAQRLIDQLRGQQTTISHESLPVRLIVRQTTGPPRVHTAADASTC